MKQKAKVGGDGQRGVRKLRFSLVYFFLLRWEQCLHADELLICSACLYTAGDDKMCLREGRALGTLAPRRLEGTLSSMVIGLVWITDSVFFVCLFLIIIGQKTIWDSSGGVSMQVYEICLQNKLFYHLPLLCKDYRHLQMQSQGRLPSLSKTTAVSSFC